MEIFVVEPDPIFRSGVCALLQRQADFDVIEEISQGSCAIERLQVIRPDIILMDTDLPDMDSTAVIQRVKEIHADIKIIMLTSAETDQEFWRVIRAGALGYLPKRISPEGLYRTLRGVHQGEVAISRSFIPKVLEQYLHSHQAVSAGENMRPPLSPREKEVLALLKTGLRNKEIADALAISENTVKTHLKRIMTKLGMANRTQLGIYACSPEHMEAC